MWCFVNFTILKKVFFFSLKVHNHFSIPISVYYMTKKGNELELVGVVEPNKQLNLPLHAIYTPTNELFFSVEG